MLLDKAVDTAVSTSDTKTFKQRLWYETTKIVPLAFFSNRTPAEKTVQLLLNC